MMVESDANINQKLIIDVTKSVVIDLLTRGRWNVYPSDQSGGLSIAEKRVLQNGLMTMGQKISSANGTMGPESSAAIIGFLSQKENLHIVPRLSPYIQEVLNNNDQRGSLRELQEYAKSEGFDPTVIRDNTTVNDLLTQPYPLSKEEMGHLQKKLRITRDQSIGRDVIGAIEDHITKHPHVKLTNPLIVDFMQRSEQYQGVLKNITRSNSGYSAEMKGLITLYESKVELYEKQYSYSLDNDPVLYYLQDRAKSGGYYKGALDGNDNLSMQGAIDAIKVSKISKSDLSVGWANKENIEQNNVGYNSDNVNNDPPSNELATIVKPDNSFTV